MTPEKTNYEYCEGNFATLHRLWTKRCEVGIQDEPLYSEDSTHRKYGKLDEAKWMCATADAALDFDIGELVTYTAYNTKKYAVVTAYDTSYMKILGHGEYRVYAALVCRLADGSETRFAADALEKADIPSDILNLVKSQLAKNCPLKEPSCLS